MHPPGMHPLSLEFFPRLANPCSRPAPHLRRFSGLRRASVPFPRLPAVARTPLRSPLTSARAGLRGDRGRSGGAAPGAALYAAPSALICGVMSARISITKGSAPRGCPQGRAGPPRGSAHRPPRAPSSPQPRGAGTRGRLGRGPRGWRGPGGTRGCYSNERLMISSD